LLAAAPQENKKPGGDDKVNSHMVFYMYKMQEARFLSSSTLKCRAKQMPNAVLLLAERSETLESASPAVTCAGQSKPPGQIQQQNKAI